MYDIMNKIGPRMERSGTALFTYFIADNSLL